MSTQDVIPYASKQHEPVRARDIFGLIVRSVGLFIALYGFYNFIYAVSQGIGFVRSPYPTSEFVLGGFLYVVAGALLMRGNWIVTFAYGRDS